MLHYLRARLLQIFIATIVFVPAGTIAYPIIQQIVAMQRLHAQVRVQQDPTVLTACQAANATGAVNATATLTITPPNGQYVYLCGVDITISFDATGGTASTNVSFTSTNLGGWAWKTSWVGTASTTIVQLFQFAFPARSAAPGTAITIVSPAANLHGAYNINGYYYFAN